VGILDFVQLFFLTIFCEVAFLNQIQRIALLLTSFVNLPIALCHDKRRWSAASSYLKTELLRLAQICYKEHRVNALRDYPSPLESFRLRETLHRPDISFVYFTALT